MITMPNKIEDDIKSAEKIINDLALLLHTYDECILRRVIAYAEKMRRSTLEEPQYKQEGDPNPS